MKHPTCNKCEDFDTCPLGDDCPITVWCQDKSESEIMALWGGAPFGSVGS